MFSNWFRGQSRPSQVKRTSFHRARPRLECLEDRVLLANQFIDLGPLRFGAENFIQNGTEYRTVGTVELGYAPTTGEAFTPLLHVEGQLSFDVSDVSPAFMIQNSKVTTIVSGAPSEVLMKNATASFAVGGLTGAAGVTVTSGVQPFYVSGVPFIAGNIRFDNPNGGTTTDAQIKLQGSVQFEKLDNLKVSVANNNYVIFDETGLQLTGVQESIDTGDMKLGKLPMKITNLGIGFNPQNNQFAFTGEFTFEIKDQTVGAGFTGAGLVITGGAITGATIEIKTHLKFSEVEITTDLLTVSYDDPSSTFTITGSAEAKIKDQTLKVALGTADTYGLVITDGVFERLDMAVTANFKLEDIEFTVGGPNGSNPVRIVYDHDADSFSLSGQVTVSELFDATVVLGTLQQPGLVIAHGKFQGINIKLSDINFGAFILDELQIEYTADILSVTVDVTFPEGWTIGGSIQFVDGKLNEIGFNYQSSNGEDGIEIGDTGIEIVGFSGKVNNLANPSELVVSGSLTAVFISPDIISLEGDFLISKDELVLDAKGSMFGGKISSFSGSLVLDWGDQDYKLTVHAEWIDGLLTFDGIFDLSNGGRDLYVRADAAVNIPKDVPFIGGTTLFSMNFVLEWHKDRPASESFVAFWIDLDLFFFHIDVGLKINFDGHPSFIGNKQVDEIDSPPPIPVNRTYTYNLPFTVPDNTTHTSLHLKWDEAGGDQTFAVKKPDGTLVPADQFLANGMAVLPQFTTEKSYALGMVGSPQDAYLPLTPGLYQLVMTSTKQFDSLPKLTAAHGQTRPTIAVGSLPVRPAEAQVSVPISGKVVTSLGPNARVNLFYDTDTEGYDGSPLPNAQGLPLTVDAQGNWTTQGIWNTNGLLPLPYYLYGVVNDGVNAPVYSAYPLTSVTPNPPVFGTVANQNGDPVTGLRILLEHQQGDAWVEAGSTITSTEGFYTFDGVAVGQTYRLNLQIPSNAYLLQPSNGVNPSTPFVYSGGSQAFSYQLHERASIHGVVYDDLNGNGIRDVGEPGLSNWTLYLDTNNNGQLDPGESHLITDQAGNYAFHDLLPPETASATYTVRLQVPATHYQTGPLPIPPGSHTATVTDPFQIVEAQNFGVVAYSTVSGNVAGYTQTNGQISSTSTPLSGWTIDLVQTNQVIATTTTDTAGNYSFGGLRTGSYTVRQRLEAGWHEASPFASTFQMQSLGSFRLPGNADATLPRSVAVADFNQDGFEDFAVLLGNTQVRYLLQVFPGAAGGVNFTSPQGYLVQPYGGNIVSPYKLVATDLTGNGSPDLVILDTLPGDPSYAVLWLITSDGVPYGPDWIPFDQGTLWGTTSPTISGMATVDLTPGGGKYPLAVLLVGAEGGSSVVDSVPGIFPVSGGIFTSLGQFGNPNLGTARNIASGDVNRDGVIDFFLGNTLYLSPSYTPLTVPGLSGDNVTVMLSDIDRDGRLDLGQMGANGLFNYGLQQPDGSFAITYTQVGSGGMITEAQLRDMDGDLLPDLVWVTSGIGSQAFFIALQKNGFDTMHQHSYNLAPSGLGNLALGIGDFNGDGLSDVMITDDGSGDIIVFQNTTTVQTLSIPVTVNETALTGQNFVNFRAGQIAGVVHDDVNLNGRQDPNEPGVAGATVYLDLNRNGVHDPDSEPQTTTNAVGAYTFVGLTTGNYRVGLVATDQRTVAPHAQPFVEASLVYGQQVKHANIATTARLLAPIAHQTVEAGSLLQVAASVPSSPRSGWVFSLEPGAPAGASIHPYSGAIQWQPSAATAGESYPITVRVRDPQQPLRTETRTFWVNVRHAADRTAIPTTPVTPSLVSRTVGPRDVRQLRSLFWNVFRRSPRRSELRYWVGRLRADASRADIVTMLWNSREHRRLQVELFFQTYLDRSPNRTERVRWIRALMSGVSEAEMIRSLLTSPRTGY